MAFRYKVHVFSSFHGFGKAKIGLTWISWFGFWLMLFLLLKKMTLASNVIESDSETTS